MRHLIKSLFMTLVVTAGAVLAMLILLNHSFFDARVNTLTFWCIVVLLACIWGAFIGEVRETTSQHKPQKSADSDAMEKLVDAAALNEAAPEEEAPFEEAAPAGEAAPKAYIHLLIVLCCLVSYLFYQSLLYIFSFPI